MLNYKKLIEEILGRNDLGIYDLMKYHFGINSQVDKKFPYSELTEIFSRKIQINENLLVKIALSIELLNSSFEVHEDVRNGNTERYKSESLWWKYGPAQAINVGDGFQAISRSVLLELSEYSQDYENILRTVAYLDKSIIEVCESENYELRLQELPQSEIEDHNKIITNKYGSLVSNCFILPSMLKSSNEQNLREFADNLVLFEKLRKEIDFFNSDDQNDSPQLGSFLSKSKPLSVIIAMRDGDSSLRRKLGEIYIQRVIDPQNIKIIKDLCISEGSLEKVKTISKDHKDLSIEIMNKLSFEKSEQDTIFSVLENI